jgi:rubrerythrin
MSKYGQVCMSCGRSTKQINKDGECPTCVKRANMQRAKWFKSLKLKRVGEQ